MCVVSVVCVACVVCTVYVCSVYVCMCVCCVCESGRAGEERMEVSKKNKNPTLRMLGTNKQANKQTGSIYRR